MTTAGRHLTAFPWGFITYTIPVLYYSVVSLFGPALKRDCICIWDRDGAGPVLADSSQQLCSPWARLQLYWVPWKAEGRCPREVGQPHSWGAHSIPAGTQHAFHTHSFPWNVFLFILLFIMCCLVAQAPPTTPLFLQATVVWCSWMLPACLLLPFWHP